MILKGKLNRLRLAIVGISTPNSLQAPLGEELFKELLDNPESEVLMMGDFNAVLDCQLYRSSASSAPGILAKFLKYKEELGIINIWRKKDSW